MPVGRAYPSLYTHIYTTGKGIVKQGFMPVEEVFHTSGYDALLTFIVGFPLFQCELSDIETDILTLYRTDIKHARLHL